MAVVRDERSDEVYLLMTLDENLQLLEESIRRLKIEYEIFFSGAARRPPYDLNSRVDTLLKRLSDEKKMSFMQRYRYNTLAARYSSYRDLWRRTLQDKELGISAVEVRTARWRAAASSQIPAPEIEAGAARESSPPYTQARSLQVQVSDPSADISKVRQMYDFLIEAQRQLGDQKLLPFSTFCTLVQEKTLKLKESAKCQNITFNVSIENDKVKFTAKPGDRT